jgi:hypothetical protein
VVAQGPALPGTCAFRQVANTDLYRRAQMPWLDRALHS